MSAGMPEQFNKVYFLGIGGIGMSAIARFFHMQGMDVSGYDADRSGMGMVLEQEGITVHYTEEESMQVDPELVIYTPAIPSAHKGLVRFLELGIPVMKRSQVLGWISRSYHCIAVAGTHGKTTTSAMITWLLRSCGVDVTAFLGGLIPDLGGNFVAGETDWVVAEADEYDRSFLTLHPRIAVVTAMDPDHLDIYGDHAAMISSYLGFLKQVKRGGVILMQQRTLQYLDDEMQRHFIENEIRLLSYGDGEQDFSVRHPARQGNLMEFVIRHAAVETQVTLMMPGVHNAMNATAAFGVGTQFGLEPDRMAAALGSFHGIKRRFEVVYADEKLVVIDDYAHHPEEIASAIGAARLQYPERRITGVFQPHLYSRTRDFYREFAAALDALDTCILVELYPARELPIEGVSSEMILKQMVNQQTYLTTKKALTSLLVTLRPEVLLLLGAGDLDRMEQEIIQNLK